MSVHKNKCECDTGERTPLNCWRCTRYDGPPSMDIDDRERAMQDLMHRHDAEACRQTARLADGTCMFLLNTGQVYEYTPSGEVRQTGHRIMQPVSDFDGVQYVPFVHMEFGTVGLVVIDDTESAERPVQFLYFNPSDHTDGDVPNVFVYQGATGNPAIDGSRQHYTIWEES